MNAFAPPSILGEDATDMDKEFFKVEVSEYVKRRNRLQSGLKKSYKLVLGQCTNTISMQI